MDVKSLNTSIFTKITAGFLRVVKHDSKRYTLPYIVKYSKGKKKWYKDDILLYKKIIPKINVLT